MGSEQSSQRNARANLAKTQTTGHPRKSKKTKEEASPEENECLRNGSTSPGPSVCSDSDLPYISSVNRPIGDSPKITSKQLAFQRGKSLSSAGNSPARRKFGGARKMSELITKGATGHDIVVVKAAKEPETQDKDPYLLKLQSIPMFLPIMRGTVNLPGMRDPEILERLDPQDMFGLCKRLQSYMAQCADHVAKNQNQITNRIRDVDFELCHLVTSLGEKQKKLSKQAEKISKVTEISLMLNKCHMQLNQTLEVLEDLNNDLPVELRLEPFVWTTG
ncbi:hypothetical protein RUM44_007742 [Polyplax serrata]|uniref:BLOC-1-related complex subunit 5 n=1 Tax=Polyplax serrata TaxID=468196 RepID=A0ABR1BAD3_POLSC